MRVRRVVAGWKDGRVACVSVIVRKVNKMDAVQLIRGSATALPLADESVQCVVTSPPYWGLRKYAGEQELMWSDSWRGAYGLEPMVEMYVQHTVEILREIRRVLRKDGVVFWNIGDSYYQGAKGNSGALRTGDKQASNSGSLSTRRGEDLGPNRKGGAGSNLKAKDLCLIPQRVALAAQADGWWVRSDIIWTKPNPMPESVTDRPTDAYEHILMLTKSARYFWDAEAVKEPLSPLTLADTRNSTGRHTQQSEKYTADCDAIPGGAEPSWYRGKTFVNSQSGRNLRNVWTFPTQPYSGAHFATFPEELPRRCILAATSAKGACRFCGAPWERISHQLSSVSHQGKTESAYKEGSNANRLSLLRQAARERGAEYANDTQTVGWRPGCGCGGVEPDDLEIIETPTGECVGEDLSMETGRAGFNRPRGDSEGKRLITRYEQRRYAEQLKASPQRGAMAAAAGLAFEHYIRTDINGARPVPDELLENWIVAGWLTLVEPPDYSKWPEAVPCVVLDPFGGSGTVGRVARGLNRRAILVDIAYTTEEGYLALAQDRCGLAIQAPTSKAKVEETAQRGFGF